MAGALKRLRTRLAEGRAKRRSRRLDRRAREVPPDLERAESNRLGSHTGFPGGPGPDAPL